MNKEIKRLDLNTPDGAQLNMDALYQIAPSVFTESRDEKTGELKRVVNFDALRQLLGDNAVDENRETYEFRWVGKDAAKAEAARAIDKTLRPVVEDSVDWDTTKNLYIEGDNLEVLKLLQRSYMGKVKMIYIDPPYNTGNDFVYHDDFAMSSDEYKEASGAVDDLGNKYVKNTEASGRFHSDWCNMIYPRLMVARSLLSEDGVIFISIDDNEVRNIQNICDEIFGITNKIGLFTIMSNPRGSQNSKLISSVHEYIAIYSKDINSVSLKGIEKDEKSLSEFREIDENGRKYRLLGLRKRGGAWRKEDRPNMFYSIFVNPKTGDCSLSYNEDYCIEVIPKRPTGELSRWTWSKDKFVKEKYLLLGKKVNTSLNIEKWDIFRKDYIDNDNGEEKTTKIRTIWEEKESNYQNAKNEIKALFGNSEIFDYPKPIYIVKRLASIIENEEDDIYLDFFSGSSSTAHAIMNKNAEDRGNRKFIMVQLKETIQDENSEAYKAGYNNICEIGKERIRRAGKKIKEEHPEVADTIDTGFRVLRLDDSNFNPGVKASPSEYNQQQLDLFANNIKTDRTDLDLLFGSILAWGLQLDLPMETEEVDGCKIYTVNDGDLVACFAEKVTDKVIEAMAEKEPLRVLFRDSCFDSDDKKINLFETFKQKLDWTDDEAFNNIRVI